jgi:hypothetical protein
MKVNVIITVAFLNVNKFRIDSPSKVGAKLNEAEF